MVLVQSHDRIPPLVHNHRDSIHFPLASPAMHCSSCRTKTTTCCRASVPSSASLRELIPLDSSSASSLARHRNCPCRCHRKCTLSNQMKVCHDQRRCTTSISVINFIDQTQQPTSPSAKSVHSQSFSCKAQAFTCTLIPRASTGCRLGLCKFCIGFLLFVIVSWTVGAILRCGHRIAGNAYTTSRSCSCRCRVISMNSMVHRRCLHIFRIPLLKSSA